MKLTSYDFHFLCVIISSGSMAFSRSRCATSKTAVLVGAQVRVLHFNLSRENNNKPTVLVFQVPRRAHIGLTVF